MKVHTSRFVVALVGSCFLGNAQSLAEDVLFNDNFMSFTLGTNWEVPNYLANQPSNVTFLGAPNVNLGIGFNGLRMTSAQTSLQERAIATTNTFKLKNKGTVEVDFEAGKFSDPGLSLPPGTNDFNIDAIVNVELLNKITGVFVSAQLFGGNFGTLRQFRAGAAPPGESQFPPAVFLSTNGPNDWQYSTYFKIIIKSSNKDYVNLVLANIYGQTLFSFPIPITFDDLGDFNLILSQSMGTPGAVYYNDVYVQKVKVSKGA